MCVQSGVIYGLLLKFKTISLNSFAEKWTSLYICVKLIID